LGLERELYTGCRESLFRIWYMTMTTYVSYGTGGWDTYTTGHCPILRGIVTGLLEFNIEQQGVCRGCALGKNSKVVFPSK
jgi:hypothetical protein